MNFGKKLVFVDNLLLDERGQVEGAELRPHLGLLSLIATVKSAGYQADIFDPKSKVLSGEVLLDASIYSSSADLILKQKPSIVGFTSLGCSFLYVIRTSEMLRKKGFLGPIMLGGPHASILHLEIMEKFDFIDIVVRHEAEETILGVLKNIDDENFEGLPGVTWRNKGCVVSNSGAPSINDLDTLPELDFSPYPMKRIISSGIDIEAGRGCPFSCTFCSTATFFGRSFRLKSAPRLVQEMLNLNKIYKVSRFKLNHDLFTVNKKKVSEFCKHVKPHNFKWSVSARTDCIDVSLLHEMADAGCDAMYFGIETGSKRMQKVSRKALDLSNVEELVSTAIDLGMKATVSFIAGYPTETEDDLNETLDMIGAFWRISKKRIQTQLHMLAPEPGTQILYDNKDNIFIDWNSNDHFGGYFDHKDEQLILNNPDLFVTFYHFGTKLERDYVNFCVDVVHCMRILGEAISLEVIEAGGGSLSKLISDVYQYRRSYDSTRQTLYEYFVIMHGQESEIVSLVRFALGTYYGQDPKFEVDKRTLDCLSNDNHELIMFEKIHNCPQLLKALEQRHGISDGEKLSDPTKGVPTNIISMTSYLRTEPVRSIMVSDQATVLVKLILDGMSMKTLKMIIKQEGDLEDIKSFEAFEAELDKIGIFA